MTESKFFVNEAVFGGLSEFCEGRTDVETSQTILSQRIENMMKSDRQFGDTQVKSDMAADLADFVQDQVDFFLQPIVPSQRGSVSWVRGTVHFVYLLSVVYANQNRSFGCVCSSQECSCL